MHILWCTTIQIKCKKTKHIALALFCNFQGISSVALIQQTSSEASERPEWNSYPEFSGLQFWIFLWKYWPMKRSTTFPETKSKTKRKMESFSGILSICWILSGIPESLWRNQLSKPTIKNNHHFFDLKFSSCAMYCTSAHNR